MNSEQDTLPNLQTVLDAINDWRQETNKQITDLRKEISTQIADLRKEISTQIADLREEMNARFDYVNSRLDAHDERFEQMRLEMMSFDARIDRLQAMSHENLNIGYNLRADVKILREEVTAWSKDVADLQLKAA